MISLRAANDDLGAFTRLLVKDLNETALDVPRQAASNMTTELRRIVRSSFGTEWRVWNAKGFASAIRYKRMGPGWWRVYSRATYVKGRSEKVDLLWVFDQPAKLVTSGKGKPGVAIPIPGFTPIAANGRRYAWPSELTRAGWTLDFAHIMGKDSVLILGRQNRFEHWKPLYIWKTSVRLPARLDVGALFEKHADSMERLWSELIDRRLDKRPGRRAA